MTCNNMEKISKIEILGHSKETNSSVRAFTKWTYLEGVSMRKQLGVCVGVCGATKVTMVINLLYSYFFFDITYGWTHPEK